MKEITQYEHVPPQENNFPIKFRLYRISSHLPPHWHEHLEILYFKEGRCDFICNGKSFSVTAGDCVIANGTDVHSFVTESIVEYYCILIYPEFFADISFKGVRLENLVKRDEFIDACMTDINDCHFGLPRGSCRDMMIKSHVYKLTAHLVENYTSAIATQKETEARESKLRRLNSVLEYVSENYAERITTKTVSDMCYLSEAHFCRFFKSEIGKSLTEYLNDYRIEKAAVLLKNTEESISAIAMQVGFDDLNYFSRLFRKSRGVSPGVYRKENRKEAQ